MTIELKDTACGYGNKVVLRNFSGCINSGEIFCILGPNGIGKTTLFKTILGFLPAMGGSITIDGRDFRKLTRKEFARYIAYVPQTHEYPFAFRVIDVVVMGRTIHIEAFGAPVKKDYDIAVEIMDHLGILSLRDRNYTELSGGERQMVLIARSLAQEPAFLLLDEPTCNLDFGNQAVVLKQILKLAGQKLGIIMTTHYPEHVLLLKSEGQQVMTALLKRRGEIVYGPAGDVLTAANLSDTYGVPVAVTEVSYEEKRLPFCQPILTENK